MMMMKMMTMMLITTMMLSRNVTLIVTMISLQWWSYERENDDNNFEKDFWEDLLMTMKIQMIYIQSEIRATMM